jgi:hypothetical protein
MGAIRPLGEALLRCGQCGSVYVAHEATPPTTLQSSLWSCETCQALTAWRPADSLRATGVVLTMRLTTSEYMQLRDVATEAQETMSDVIREAMYEWHGIGDLCATSITAASSVSAKRSVMRGACYRAHADVAG